MSWPPQYVRQVQYQAANYFMSRSLGSPALARVVEPCFTQQMEKYQLHGTHNYQSWTMSIPSFSWYFWKAHYSSQGGNRTLYHCQLECTVAVEANFAPLILYIADVYTWPSAVHQQYLCSAFRLSLWHQLWFVHHCSVLVFVHLHKATTIGILVLSYPIVLALFGTPWINND